MIFKYGFDLTEILVLVSKVKTFDSAVSITPLSYLRCPDGLDENGCQKSSDTFPLSMAPDLWLLPGCHTAVGRTHDVDLSHS